LFVPSSLDVAGEHIQDHFRVDIYILRVLPVLSLVRDGERNPFPMTDLVEHL
jgi:hypothetical protein